MVLTSDTMWMAFIASIYIRLQTCCMLFIICMASCWPLNQGQHFSSLESKLWRNAAPSAFYLQRNMLCKGICFVTKWQNTIWISFA